MSQQQETPSERNERTSCTLAWFFLGATAGAAVALLYAPRSGQATRRLITEKATEGRQAVSGTSREVVDRSREVYEKSREFVDDAVDLFERGRKLARG